MAKTDEQTTSPKAEPKVAAQVSEDTTNTHADLIAGKKGIVEHNPEGYLLSGPDGDFNASEAMYRRVYSKKEDLFKVKKSPTHKQ